MKKAKKWQLQQRFKYLAKLTIVDSILLSCLLLSITCYCKNSTTSTKTSNTESTDITFSVSLNSGVTKEVYSFLTPNITSSIEKKVISTVQEAPKEILEIQYQNYLERHQESTEQTSETSEEKAVDTKDDMVSTLKIKYTSPEEIYNSLTYPLAKIIFAEGGNQNDEFQQNVGYVVLNRIESKYYPNTLYDVFFSSDSYAETSRTSYRNEEVSEKAIENAKIVVEQYFNNAIPVSPARVFQAEFKQGIDIYQIGNTFFGSDPRIVKDMEETTK